MVEDGMEWADDFIVCVGFPGEEHSLKEFVTPNQVMIRKVYDEIAASFEDVAWACWDWVCTQIRYPTDIFGRYRDTHELNAFGLRHIRSKGEFFQLPFRTLTVRIGDCFDTSAVLASLLRNQNSDVRVAIGAFRGLQDIDHAWVVANIGGKDRILETTLRRAANWKSVEELPGYSPQVIFNDQEIWAKGEDDLFCHSKVSYASRIAQLRRCWGGYC